MDANLVGRTLLGKLRVVRHLGSGGMGAVYEVEHLMTGHRRALKVLHPALAEDAQAVSRLLREASIAGKVASPRLVETLDVARLEDGSVFVLMELLVGRSLDERLRASGPLPVSEVVRLGIQIGEGLAAAHASGVIHRDLTPRNVFLVGPRGAEEVKLVDFGLAKMLPGHTDRFGVLTQTGTLLGTPSYMAPEQVTSGRDVDARADQYALAVVLYECLTGDKAFGASGLAAAIAAIASGDHVPLSARRPELDPTLTGTIERAMRVDPALRFANVTGLTDALRRCAQRADVGTAETQLVREVRAPIGALGVHAADASQAAAGPLPDAERPRVPPGVATAPVSAPTTPSTRTPPGRPTSSEAAGRTGGGRLVALGLGGAVIGLLILGGAMLGTRALLVSDDASSRSAPSSATGEATAPIGAASDEARSVPELDALMAAEDYRGCLALARRLDQSVHVLERRVSCAQNVADQTDFRQSCHALRALDPANATAVYCTSALGEAPP